MLRIGVDLDAAERQDLHPAIPKAHEDMPAIRRPGQAIDPHIQITIPSHPARMLSGQRVPDMYLSIIPARGNLSTIGRPTNGMKRLEMPLILVDLGAGG